MTKSEKKAYDAQYYQQHKEHIKQRVAKYYRNNKEEVQARTAAWYADKMQQAHQANAIAAENERLRAQIAQMQQAQQTDAQ